MILCVILVWLTKFENSLSFMQNMFDACEYKVNWLKILILGKLDSKQMFLKSILMHFIHKIQCFEEILHKIALIFKNLFFLEFRLIEIVSWPIKIAIKILVNLCLFWSVLNWCWISWSIFDRTNLFFDQLKVV